MRRPAIDTTAATTGIGGITGIGRGGVHRRSCVPAAPMRPPDACCIPPTATAPPDWPPAPFPPLENGVFPGNTLTYTGNTSVNYSYVTALLKGNSGNHWALKAGNAQSGSLMTMFDGARPAGYSPMKKEGAIVLGIGGDNSHTGEGTFFEGCMTSGYSTDATDNAVQANIVAAGYGR